MKKRPIIGLALGGGGALGFAHIGVLEVLQENNIPIDMVVGTSMGAIVGACWCNGTPCEKLENFAKNLKTRKLMDISFGLKGLIAGKKVVQMLSKIIPHDKNIEDLHVKFACNAVNVSTGEEIVFEKGNIIKAVRSSLSVPGIFAPVHYNGMTLVDGGVVNNLPHDIARNLGADIVIAVDVVSSSKFASSPKTAIGVLAQSWLIAQQESQSNRKKFYNIKITPEIPHNKQYVFEEKVALDIIKQGRIAAEIALPKILQLIDDFPLKTTKKK